MAIAAAAIGFLIGLVVFGAPWHLPPAWGDIPSCTSAIATVGLLIGAIITAMYAIKAFRTQSAQLKDQREINAKQTEVLGLQVTELRESIDERRREAWQRRRAQAARIFIGAPRERDGWVRPSVKNASDFPIYEAKLWYISPDGLSVIPRDDGYRGTIQPGAERPGPEPFPSKEGLRRTILTFRDANNVFWIRMPGGALEEQPARPELESVRAALRTLPLELGPRGAAVHRARGEDALDADDYD